MMHVDAGSRLLQCIVAALLCGVVAPGTAGESTPPATLQIADMARIADLAAPASSPDGKWIAYAVSRQDLKENRIVSHVWLIGPDGASRELGAGDSVSSWLPQFAHADDRLVYLSDRGASKKAQVWMQSPGKDDAVQVTRFEEGVTDFVLSPDGRQLAVVAEVSNGETDDGPIVIDRYQFKDDERGYLTKKRRRLFRVSLDNASQVPLTADDVDAWQPAWSPDGQLIAYVSKRQHEPDRHTGYNVNIIHADGSGRVHTLSKDGLINNDPDHLSRPAWSPDSQRVAYLQGGPERLLEYAPWELVDADLASGTIRKLGKTDRNATHPHYSADGHSLFAIVEESSTAYLTRIDLASGKPRNLTNGARMDFDFSVDDHDRVTLLTCASTFPCRLHSLTQQGETVSEAVLADHNAWLKDYALAPSEDFSTTGKDGTVVQSLLVKPLDYQPGRHYPTIVRVHGGPVYQFSHEFMFDWQIWASRGYVVLGVNPRGSSGRGQKYAQAIWADWGHHDVTDVLAATDRLVAQGIADPDRLGIGGWSYGGMLTDYTIASTTRFKAAIAGAGAANIVTNYGSDEYIVWLENELGTPWNNLDAYLKVSYPFFHNDRIKTPTLFFCAALDFNVPCIGSEQMYQALVSRRVPTGLIVYRDQHHELDVPSLLADRLTRYVEWYDRFLKQP